MDIILKTRNCDVGDRLKQDTRERVAHATRIYDRIVGVELVFSEEPNPRIAEPAFVEVTARTKGHHIRAEGAGTDHRAAVDAVIGRFESQLRKYKTRVVDRWQGRGRAAPQVAPDPAAVMGDGLVSESPIVRRKAFEIHAMAPDDAVVQLELLGHDFFLFRSSEGTGGACSVVYRRNEGDYGLIEAVG